MGITFANLYEKYNTYLIDRSPQELFRANETQRNDGTKQQQLLRIPTGRRQTSRLCYLQVQLGS